MTEILDAALLGQVLRYDPETGELFWLHRERSMFSRECMCRSWNAKWAGKPAFKWADGFGYHRGHIFDRSYYAHRVIFALVTGVWPTQEIDHINGVKSDNRWENLRAVSSAENMRNKAKPLNNTSGVVGVCWHKAQSKWVAYIRNAG